MFRLPAPPRFCELSDADSQLAPDGTEAWSRVKDEGTALFKAGEWEAAASKYMEGFRVAMSVRAQAMPLLLGALHSRSTSPLRVLGDSEPRLLERIIQTVYLNHEPRFAARLDINAKPVANRDSKGVRCGEFVPTSARDDHPAGYPHKRVDGTVHDPPPLLWDAARGGSVLTELGQPEGLYLPNKNGAICAANAAAAYLKLEGRAEDALKCGLQAVACCPEYPKASHRVVSAVKAGARGDFPDPKGHAEQLDDQLQMFRAIRRAQTEGVAAAAKEEAGDPEDEEEVQGKATMLEGAFAADTASRSFASS